MSTFNESQHPRGQVSNAGQFREKLNSTPTALLDAAEDAELCSRCGKNEPAQYEVVCKDCMWATCDECGDDIDPAGGSSTCDDCSGAGAYAEAEAVVVGAGATRISAAQARRELAQGARVQPVYLRPNRAGDPTAAPAPRTVTKQTPHEMITRSEEHPDGVHLSWKGASAQRDAHGTVIISDDEGQPYVAFIPLAEGQEPFAAPSIDLPEVRDFIEARESTSEADLHRVAQRATTDAVRRSIARNPASNAITLDVLAQAAVGKSAQEAIVEHPQVSSPTLSTLAKSEHFEVRYRVAVHPRADAATLTSLAGDSKAGVRMAVARNVNTPTRVLDALAESRDSDVRNSVASNPNASPEMLERLSRGNGFTMSAVAANPSAPQDVIRRLWEDTSTGNQTRAMVASNPSAPPEIIAAAVADKDSWVRRHAAGNTALSAQQEAVLAADGEESVRRALASSSTRQDTLAALARDSSAFVRSSVARNNSSTAEVLRALTGDDRAAAIARDRLENKNGAAE